MITNNQYIQIHVIISVMVFVLNFYWLSGKSGGDIVLILYVLIFNAILMIAGALLAYSLKFKVISKLILFLFLVALAELTVIVLFGNEINSFFRGIKYPTTH